MLFEFRASLKTLLKSLEDLSVVIPNQDGIWLAPEQSEGLCSTNSKEPKEAVREHFTNIWYSDGLSTTKRLQGAVICDELCLSKVLKVNEAKKEFKNAVISLKNESGRPVSSVSVNAAADEIFRNRYVAKALVDMGHPNLCLLEAYRQIPIYREVKRASFTWSCSNKSDINIDYDEAVKLVIKKINSIDPEKAQFYIDRLRRSGQKSFLVRRNVQVHSRCNILFNDGKRKTIVSHSPILFNQQELPDIRWVTKEEVLEKNRKRRTDYKEAFEVIPEFNIFSRVV